MTKQSTLRSLKAALPLSAGLMAAGGGFAALAWWVATPPSPQPVLAAAESAAEEDLDLAAPVPVEIVDPTGPLAVEAVEEEGPSVGLPSDRPLADHLGEAETALEEGEVARALASLRHHLAHNPETQDVLLRVARLAEELDDRTLATAALERAEVLTPDDPEVSFRLARVLLEDGRLAKARTAAKVALRLSPESSSAWALHGRAEMAVSEWDAAELAFDRALDLEPANAHLYNYRGLLLVLRKRGAEAADALQTSVALFGDEVPAYVLNNLGLAHELEGALEPAREAFEQALAASPFYVKARVNLRRVEAAERAAAEANAVHVADGSGGIGWDRPDADLEADSEVEGAEVSEPVALEPVEVEVSDGDEVEPFDALEVQTARSNDAEEPAWALDDAL